ncbi:Uncharacterised protein [Mycobacterium tuberculosis]|nr:Uncharacterised protein [Mycobacterium tuberculosis]
MEMKIEKGGAGGIHRRAECLLHGLNIIQRPGVPQIEQKMRARKTETVAHNRRARIERRYCTFCP